MVEALGNQTRDGVAVQNFTTLDDATAVKLRKQRRVKGYQSPGTGVIGWKQNRDGCLRGNLNRVDVSSRGWHHGGAAAAAEDGLEQRGMARSS